MRKVGIAVGALNAIYGTERMLELVAEIGADCIDFPLTKQDYRNSSSIYSKSDEEIIEYYSRIGEYARKVGVEISQTHGRIRTYINDPVEDTATLENARRDLLATKALGAPVSVMHGPTTCRLGVDAPPELMHDLAFSFFDKALEFAAEYDVMLATETFGDATGFGVCDFFGNTSEFLKLYDRVKKESANARYFTICVDTGHSNKAMIYNGNPTPADVIRACGKNVTCLHLNDNDSLTDQHKPPRTGIIDWDDVMNALDEIGYDGVYNMELALKRFGEGLELDTAAFAIKIMRNILNGHYGEK